MVGSGAMWLAVVMVCAWAGAGAGAAGAESFLTSISRNLRAEMAGVLELAVVNYSQPQLNTTYSAKLEFDMRAMGPVYNSTHLVIDVIADKQAYPEGVVEVLDGHVELASWSDSWKPLLAHFAGPLAVATVALLLAASLPLAGLFWCCCYWWRTGRRRRPFDRKYDGCIKGLLAILLIALLTLFMMGVVVAFATDAQVEQSLSTAPATTRAGLKDADAFLDDAARHVRHLLVDNYQQLERKLNAMLTSSGLTISVQLGEFSHAVSVTTLAGMVRRLDGVQADLRRVQALTKELRAQAERLNTVLRSVKAQLLTTLARCDQPQCIRLQEKHKIGQLDTEIHYSQMPDVSALLNNVTALLESDIRAEVEEGQQVFRNIQREVQRSVDEHIPAVQEQITDTGRRLERVAESVSWLSGNASRQLRQFSSLADEAQSLHSEYGPYRKYASLAAAVALLAMTSALAWGLMCGVCGKRPDVYGAADCCNKGNGSSALLCGMGLMFLLGGAVCLVLLLYFTVGLVGTRFICDPLTEPRGNRLFVDVERFVMLEQNVFNKDLRTSTAGRGASGQFNLTAVMLRCHANHTIYRVLELHRLYDLNATRREASKRLAAATASLRPTFAPSGATILRASAKAKLRQLAETGLSDFDFDRILHALESNMTSLSLDALGTQLEGAAAALARRPGFDAVAEQLHNASLRLALYHNDIVLPMLAATGELNATALRLRDALRFNHSSLKEAIAYLLDETQLAESFLNTQGPDLIQNMTREFAEVVAAMCSEYMDMVVISIEQDVGRCGPLSNAFNATRDAHCKNILMPVNGYWMALAWCVLLFVPLMLTAQRLARLYLHVDPYPGPLVEAEYLYDAYADRDNVPLANAYKAEKRSGRERRSAGGGASASTAAGPAGAGAGDARRALPPAPDAHARRYNDMAPKHWEEGPPRYHGPTEYERPPPYYYPGPTDRQ